MSDLKQGVNIPIYQELPFKYTLLVEVPQGGVLTGSAYMRVYSAVGEFIYGTWHAVLTGNSFVWEVPQSGLHFLEHGARYRIYMEQTGEADRVLAQFGKLYWEG